VASSTVEKKRSILIVDDDRDGTLFDQKPSRKDRRLSCLGRERRCQGSSVIFLTARVTKAEAKAGLRIQGRPVLAKPINIPKLTNSIEENLTAGG
jgi:CheY-like chemotaxis protein